MSAWRILTRRLHAIGGTGELHQFDDVGGRAASSGLTHMERMGLVIGPGRGGKLWRLTKRGADWCEGRLTEKPAPRIRGSVGARMRFVATWLAALPRGLRIE